ncbi:hypothetical protein B0H13DRAFT_2385120 [Mycena leptocephala]|nr:hypothetical protein B0H13DRAFT_2385120 [Mycena leptocephala]
MPHRKRWPLRILLCCFAVPIFFFASTQNRLPSSLRAFRWGVIAIRSNPIIDWHYFRWPEPLLAVEMVTNPSFNDHTKPLVSEIFWITASAAADAAIAIGLQVVSRRGPLPFHGPSFYLSLASRHFAVRLRVGVIGAAFSSPFVTNLSLAIIISLGRIYTHTTLRNPNLRDPKPAEVRQSLPHATQLISYPFMPDTSGTTASQEMQKKGGRPFISAGMSSL